MLVVVRPASAEPFQCDAHELGQPQVDLPVTLSSPSSANADTPISIVWTVGLNNLVTNLSTVGGTITKLTLEVAAPPAVSYLPGESKAAGIDAVSVSEVNGGLHFESTTELPFSANQQLPVLSVLSKAKLTQTATFDSTLLHLSIEGHTTTDQQVTLRITCTTTSNAISRSVTVNGQPPTTAAPPTVAPTSVAPTTVAPTTVAPTTAVTTSVVPPATNLPRTGSSSSIIVIGVIGALALRVAAGQRRTWQRR